MPVERMLRRGLEALCDDRGWVAEMWCFFGVLMASLLQWFFLMGELSLYADLAGECKRSAGLAGSAASGRFARAQLCCYAVPIVLPTGVSLWICMHTHTTYLCVCVPDALTCPHTSLTRVRVACAEFHIQNHDAHRHAVAKHHAALRRNVGLHPRCTQSWKRRVFAL